MFSMNQTMSSEVKLAEIHGNHCMRCSENQTKVIRTQFLSTISAQPWPSLQIKSDVENDYYHSFDSITDFSSDYPLRSNTSSETSFTSKLPSDYTSIIGFTNEPVRFHDEQNYELDDYGLPVTHTKKKVRSCSDFTKMHEELHVEENSSIDSQSYVFPIDRKRVRSCSNIVEYNQEVRKSLSTVTDSHFLENKEISKNMECHKSIRAHLSKTCGSFPGNQFLQKNKIENTSSSLGSYESIAIESKLENSQKESNKSEFDIHLKKGGKTIPAEKTNMLSPSKQLVQNSCIHQPNEEESHEIRIDTIKYIARSEAATISKSSEVVGHDFCDGNIDPRTLLASHLRANGLNYEVISAQKLSARRYFLVPTDEHVAAYDSAVLEALRSEDIGALRVMLKGGRNLQCCNRFGESILHSACRRGMTGVVKFLIEEAGISGLVVDDCGRTPMHDACWAHSPSVELVEILLKRWSALLLVSDNRGHTPLQYVRRENWAFWCLFLEGRKDMLKPIEFDSTNLI
uniref:Uncharacterized protein n=1 Tax=Corethron hystrix TaxID=216773 RepID=A0A7S1BMJ0_9STRA|mmetsp:Transcript_32252/g.74256  ORF Transcript_32252/g.74256 Transcript_32252/m.74256 type:complete len:514 (+) Transcript_32252:417-1958(+)